MKRTCCGVIAIWLILLPIYPASAQQDEQLRRELKYVTSLMGAALQDRAPLWRCEISTKYVCTSVGCALVKPTVWINLDFGRRVYERCDSKRCDAYDMTFTQSGIFTLVSPNQGTFLKAVNDGSEFVEVASLGVQTYNGFGQCIPG